MTYSMWMLRERLADLLAVSGEELDKLPEIIGKTALGVVAVAYTCGFLITNIYLGWYGVGTAGMVRGEYVLTGFSFLFLLLVSSLLGWFLASMIDLSLRQLLLAKLSFMTWPRDRSGARRALYTKRTEALVYILFAALMYANLLGTAMYAVDAIDVDAFRTRAGWIGVIITMLLPSVVVVPYTIFKKDWQRWESMARGDRSRLIVAVALVFIFGLLPALSVYSRAMYPMISRSYGGGRPLSVRLIIDGEQTEPLRGTLARVRDDTGACELLAETNDWILVRKGPGFTFGSARPLRLQRSLVRAIEPIDRRR